MPCSPAFSMARSSNGIRLSEPSSAADHDDRVVPGHSFKFAATMQAAQAGDAPVLIRIETRAGHGGGGVGVPTTKLIEQAADRWGFLVHVLGVEQQVGSSLRAGN